MRALVKPEPGRGPLRLDDVPDPRPGPGEVRIRVAATGICGTDLHIRDGEYPSSPPVVLGHEFSGIVDEVGAGVTGRRPGDRVVAQPQALTCGRCRHCQRGELNLCPDRRSIGSGIDGAFAASVVVPARVTHVLPEAIDLVHAALMEPVAVAVRAVLEQGEVARGERVLVTGPGPIGILCAQVARGAGAEVLLVGLPEDAARLKLAGSLGLATLTLPRAEAPAAVTAALGGEADRALECSGAAAGIDLCLGSLRAQGTLVQVGLGGAPRAIGIDRLVIRELRLVGTFAHTTASWQRALPLAAGGTLALAPLISHRLPLSRWEEGFGLLDRRQGLKIVLIPDQFPD